MQTPRVPRAQRAAATATALLAGSSLQRWSARRRAKLSQLPDQNFSVRPQRPVACDGSRVLRASRAASCSSCLELLASVPRCGILRSQDTYPIRPADAAQRPVAPLFASRSGMTKSEATNRGGPKRWVRKAFDSVSTVRQRICPKDCVARRTAARADDWSLEQLSAAARRPRRKQRRRVQRCELRTHGCDRIADASLQLARALQP